MKINTRDFGEVEIDEKAVIEFPNGIIGFEDSKRYALIDPTGEGNYPMWLQSVEDVYPCFIVFDPNQINPGYSAEINTEEQKTLGIDETSAACFLVLATVPEDIKSATVNMRSPIVVNRDKNKAIQIVLNNLDYSFRQPLFGGEG